MQKRFITAFLIFLFASSGCAPRLIINDAPPDTPIVFSEEEALTFGRIRWIENGEERENFSTWTGFDLAPDFLISIGILRVEDMKEGTIKIEEDRRFFVLLPKGTYIIHRIDWNRAGLVPRVAFKVADGQHSYYLGTLSVDVQTKRTTLGTLLVKGGEIHIVDEEENAMGALRKRYPQQEIKVTKDLMIYDPSIPRMEELETQKTTLDALRHLLGGVIPSLH